MNNLEIFVHKTGAMNDISKHVARGYVFYVSGSVKPDRLNHFYQKLSDKFYFNLSKHQRARRKKSGKFNAHFVAFPRYTAPVFDWWILLTEDVSKLGFNERVYCAEKKNQRLRFLDRFELIQLPRSGREPSWTWRISPHYFDELKQSIVEAVRKKNRNSEFLFLIKTIHRLPGFRGVRNQVFQLRKTAIGELTRIQSDADVEAIKKRYIAFTRYQKFPTVNASMVVQRLEEGRKPFKHEWKYPDDQKQLVSLEEIS